MNRKQFLILLVVVAALVAGGAALFMAEKGAWKQVDNKAGQQLVPGLSASAVAEIRIVESERSLTMKKGEGGWGLAERGGFPANVERIGELLLKLVEAKVVQTESVAESQRGRLLLAEPKAGAKDAGTLLELKDAGGKPLARLMLGKPVPRTSQVDGAKSGGASGRYVLVGDEKTSVAVIADPLSSVEAKPEAWIAKELVKVERVKALVATGADGRQRFSLLRDGSDLMSNWKFVGASEKPDGGKVQDMVSAIYTLSLLDVLTDAAKSDGTKADTGLDKPVTFRAETWDGLVYTLKIGAPARTAGGEAAYHLQVVAGGELIRTRIPPKDEKAEDKPKNDKDWEERMKKMDEQIAREKKLSSSVFLVGKGVVEPLLREKAQLLPEKKKDDGKKG
jgi:hypothetical protein